MKKRMEKIIEYCPCCGTAADIGCDHGRISAALIERGICGKVIAADISSASLQKTEVLARDKGFQNKIDTRCGDGLGVLTPGEAEAIIIAGMGSELIADIIKQGEKAARAAKSLILCPHSHPEKLRTFLIKNGYRILSESCVTEDGKFYIIIKAKSGQAEAYSAEELEMGKRALFDDGFDDYVAWMLRSCRAIRDEIERAGGDTAKWDRRIEALEKA